ncbi:MAG: BTAD domain-containing putative transcriptional regulator [Chloroflexota bacterium]
MSQLTLRLLGPPLLEVDSKPIDIGRRKAIALLAYLATTGEAHHRDTLASLFWPEYDQSTARSNLRRTLSALNKSIGQGLLISQRSTVALASAFEPTALPEPMTWLDVAHFRHLLATCQRHEHPVNQICEVCLSLLGEAVALYRNDFLAGFTLRDSPDFDDWQYFEGESLRQELADALERLVYGHLALGELDQAIAYARRWLALDPLHEPVHRHLMMLYAKSNRQAVALRQYEQCVQVLQEEMGVSPSSETQELHTAIRTGRLQPASTTGLKFTPGSQSTANRSQSTAHAPLTNNVEEPPSTKSIADTNDEPTAVNELRLVAVLCVAIVEREVGMALSPERIAAQMNQLTEIAVPIVERYEAHLEWLRGETALAFFGVDRTHEDDTERALHAVLELMATAKEMDMVVAAGVAMGTVFVGQLGKPQAITNSGPQISGPVVTLASRLQGAAESDEILVSEALYRQTYRAFRMEPLQEQIRGVTGNPYQLLRPRRQARKTRGIEGLRAELIGRRDERTKLLQAVEQVKQGQGQMICLVGDAGLGKSRLMAELQLALGDSLLQSPTNGSQAATTHHPLPAMKDHLLWLEGRCLEMGTSARYWPILDALRSYLGWKFDEDEPTRAGRIGHVLEQLVTDEILTDKQREEIGPLLGYLLSLRFGNEWDERLAFAAPEQLRHRTLIGLHDLFVAISHQQPTILVLEDLHWADPLTLDLIAVFMEALADIPLLLLCIYRPEQAHRCWQLATQARRKCPERFTELHLRELTPSQSRRMIASLLAIDNLPESVREMIQQKSAGNPFFVEEVVRSLIDAGLVSQLDGRWQATQQIETVTVPESVQSLVMARVDRLEPPLKRVLQQAAIIGRLFSLRLVAQLVSQDSAQHIDLGDALSALTEQAFIYQERIVPEEEYSFKHALARDAVYHSLLLEQRQRYHRQAALALENLHRMPRDDPHGRAGEEIRDEASAKIGYEAGDEIVEQLAYHYDQSGSSPDSVEKAIVYLLRAGAKAHRAYLNEEAVGYYQRVQALLNDIKVDESALAAWAHIDWQQWEFEALQGLALVYTGMGNLVVEEDYLRQAIALGEKINISPPKLIRLYYELGEVLFWLSRYDERIRLGKEGLALLDGDTESVEAVMMTSLIARAYNAKGEQEMGHRLTLRNLKVLEQLPYSQSLRPAHIHATLLYRDEKNIGKATKWLRTLQAKAEAHHDLYGLADAYGFMSLVLYSDQGDVQQGITYRQRSLELFTQIGAVKNRCECLTNIGNSLLSLGEIEQGETYLLRALEIVEEDSPLKVFINFQLSQLLIYRHEWESVIERLQRLRKSVPEGDHYGNEVLGIYVRGQASLALGRRSEALEYFSRIFDRLAEPNSPYWGALMTYGAYFGTVQMLSAVDEAYQDPEAFRAFCHDTYQVIPDTVRKHLSSWYLTPCEVDSDFNTIDFGFDTINLNQLPGQIQTGDWQWNDPFDDCSFAIQSYLTLYAANERDLWLLNRSAPRLLRPASGDFAVETICVTNLTDQPSIGGLLLWQNEENYLRLCVGIFGKSEINFLGNLNNEDLYFGRGRLPSEQIYLRLERLGEQVTALCSADGVKWYTVGSIAFPFDTSTDEPLSIGVHAIGTIVRTIYHGAYPEGTAVSFKSFQLLRKS